MPWWRRVIANRWAPVAGVLMAGALTLAVAAIALWPRNPPPVIPRSALDGYVPPGIRLACAPFGFSEPTVYGYTEALRCPVNGDGVVFVKYAYYPDTTNASFDKQNVRDGHYVPWSPTPYLSRITPGTTTFADPNARRVFELVMGTRTGDDVEGLMHVVSSGLVPECVMKVKRAGDGADLALYTEFDSWSALHAYEVHPLHEELKRLIGPLRVERRVVDYEVS